MIQAGEVDLTTRQSPAFVRAFHGGRPVTTRDRYARKHLEAARAALRRRGNADVFRTAPIGRVKVKAKPSRC